MTWDCVVIGAGPAGSCAASWIAMAGNKVLIVEKGEFPRHRIGESLLPSSCHLFADLLGFREKLEGAGFKKKFGGTFRWGRNKSPWSFTFSDAGAGPYAWQVERYKFDKMLLDHALELGAQIKQPVYVTSLIRENGRAVGVKLSDGTEERAKWIIDASGGTSRIADQIAPREVPDFFRNLAVYGYLRVDENFRTRPEQGSIVCEAFDQGWMWLIPLRDDMVSIGAVVGDEHAEALRDPEGSMEKYLQACGIIREDVGPYTPMWKTEEEGTIDDMYRKLRVVKDYSYNRAKYAEPGLMLIGDAACFIDPVFSSGVHLAQYSALLAARVVNTRVKGELDDATVLAEFDARYRREYSHFFRFLVSFYDMHEDESSYFWTARSVLDTKEPASDAFLRLISGSATGESLNGASRAIEAYFRKESAIDDKGKAGFANEHGRAKRLESMNLPVEESALVTSSDLLHWRKARRREMIAARIVRRPEVQEISVKLKGIIGKVRGKAPASEMGELSGI